MGLLASLWEGSGWCVGVWPVVTALSLPSNIQVCSVFHGMASPGTGYEPLPREAPFTASIGGKLYMWGGTMLDWSERGKRQAHYTVEVFDPYVEVWSQQPTTGTPPPLGLYSGACASIADCMYICCGYDGSSWHNSLHELCVTTWKWREIKARNPSQGPVRMSGCRMVVDENKLVLLGELRDGPEWSSKLHTINPNEGLHCS